MNDANRDLLDQVISESLSNVLNAEGDSEEAKTYFRQAMDAIDRQINLNKVDCAYQESYDRLEGEKLRIEEVEKAKIEIEKQKLELENSKTEFEKSKLELEAARIEIEREKTDFDRCCKEQEDITKEKEVRNDMIFRGIEIVCGCIVAPLIGYGLNRGLSKVIMRWEEGNTFTTTPGKSLKGLFQFRR